MLHKEEHHSLYRLCNIFRVIKSDRLGWGGHVARMEEVRSALIILTGIHLQEDRLIGLKVSISDY